MQDVQARETNPWVSDVATFQEKFEKKFDTSTGLGVAKLIMHRLDLVHEEQLELYTAAGQMITALGENDGRAYGACKVVLLDAIAGEIYVLIGMANALNMDLTGGFAEVQRSNMSKLGRDGKQIFNAAGKTLKGPDYTPPNLWPYIKR